MPALDRDPTRVSSPAHNESALLNAIFESAMDAIVAVDSDQTIVRFNTAAERMFGYERGEVLGHPLDQLLPARFLDAHRHHVRSFIATGDTTRAMGHLRPLVARRSDGTEFPIEATISQVKIQGRPFATAIVRDITARRQAETDRLKVIEGEVAARAEAASVAEQRDRLQEILDNLPAGVVIAEGAGATIAFSNAAFAQLVTSSDTSAATRHHQDFTMLRSDGTPLDANASPLRRALAGERLQNLQLVVQRLDGSRIPVSIHAAPIYSASATKPHAIVIFQDVTLLQQADQLKDDFLALVSHELRTPLTAINGGARLLSSRGRMLSPEERVEILNDVVIESERLDQLLGNLTTLSSLLGGRLEPATEPILIGPLIRSVTASVDPRYPSLMFAVDLPAATPPVEADPALVEQLLRNLYENAAKYSPDGGRIATQATVAGGRVTISIADEGIGIAPQHLDQIFERFRRVGDTSGIRGMGLGLYLSRMLAEAQGGTITATSPGPGLGSTFSISLPVARG